MGKDYSVGLMKLVKMTKKGDRQARLILAVTDLTRALDAIDPENASEDVKQNTSAAFISNAGDDARAARQNLRKAARELSIARRWLREAS